MSVVVSFIDLMILPEIPLTDGLCDGVKQSVAKGQRPTTERVCACACAFACLL